MRGLLYEAMHMAGHIDEGAAAGEARALAVAYWRTVYPAMPDGYRSSACRPGGAMDEHLPDPPWAPAGA